MQPATESETNSAYGSNPGKRRDRIAELRDYYAQLYASHGLKSPLALRDTYAV